MKPDEIIDHIAAARERNNLNWIEILRIAMEHAPEKTKRTLLRINKTDDRISALTKKLAADD